MCGTPPNIISVVEGILRREVCGGVGGEVSVWLMELDMEVRGAITEGVKSGARGGARSGASGKVRGG